MCVAGQAKREQGAAVAGIVFVIVLSAPAVERAVAQWGDSSENYSWLFWPKKVDETLCKYLNIWVYVK